MKKKALITGIAGQDGSYLAELLLSKGYEVHGIEKMSAFEDNSPGLVNIQHIKDQITLHACDIENQLALYKIIGQVTPDECYHLAAYSFVSYSFEDEFSIINANLHGTHCVLAALKELTPKCRIYNAGSSEMFGVVDHSPQDESTPFNPRSIYGISKLAGYHLLKNYRRQHNLFGCTGIMYNHESPRRGHSFLPRKVSLSVAKIKLGLQDKLRLGNLDAVRDWGYAPDYVEAMWLMLQQEKADDYVIATGELHSVKELVEIAFNYVKLDYRDYLEIDKQYYRASDATPLCGNNTKAQKQLNWRPKKDFKEIIEDMIEKDIQSLGKKT